MTNQVGPGVPDPATYNSPIYATANQPRAVGTYPPAMPAQNTNPSMFMQPQPQTQTVHLQIGAIPNPFAQEFPPYPFQTKCKKCNDVVTTDTEQEMGAFAMKMCFILCFSCACCCVPCCSQWKDTVHSCPKCKTVLGRNIAGRQYRGSPGTFMAHPMA